MTKVWVISFLLFLCIVQVVEAVNNLEPYPPAEKEMVRYVLHLPKRDDESVLMVELLVGKTLPVDEPNRYMFSGEIEPEIVQGWGVILYKVKNLGALTGTLIGTNPSTPKVPRFIPLAGKPYIIRYDSEWPIVVYVPADAEVRYRVWASEGNGVPVEKG